MSHKQPISTFLGIAAAVVLAASSHAAIIDVPGGQPTIQLGIDAAVNGDEVVVAIGTYNETINFNGKAITVRSTDPNDVGVVMNTIINAQGVGRVVTCTSGEGPDTVLSGFTITGGSALKGAGMWNAGSSPTVSNCRFIDNVAANNGGGMLNSAGSSPTVTNCTFSGNDADAGAGMRNAGGSSPTVTNCTFSGNCARGLAAGFGGGMNNNNNSNPTVTNCRFSENDADSRGGGMFNNESSPTVTNCHFDRNVAIIWGGGGMANFLNSNPTVTNCSFNLNVSGGEGGGMRNEFNSNPTVTNCILWGDRWGAIPNEIFDDASTSTVTFSDVQGGFAGAGNINANPRFISPTNTIFHNLRLQRDSPCIDAADNTAPALAGITTDLGGNPRFVDDPCTVDTGNPVGEVIVDMGAYEFQPSCPADVNCDGAVNVLDLVDLLLCFGQPAIPGCVGEDINEDGNVNVLDLIDLLLAFGSVCPDRNDEVGPMLVGC